MAVRKTLKLTLEQRKLVEENTGLVFFALRKEYGAKYAADEDNVSEGMYALCRAAAGYDPAEGCKFSVYAYTTIINWMRHLARMSNAPGRKPDTPLVSLDAPVKLRDGEKSEKTVGHCIRDKSQGPEEKVCALSDAEMYRVLLDAISKDEPMVMEFVRGKNNGCLQRIADLENVTKQAVHARFKRKHDRVRRKYAKEYRRIMGYDTDDRRRA